MSLAKKLQIPAGERVRVLNAPPGLSLDIPTTDDARGGAILFFAPNSKMLKARGDPVLEAARSGRLAWIAYPKAGQLGTDLNRDILWRLMEPEGVRPVRRMRINDVWSALRFRPA